jgi:hypothetical protein
LTEQAFLSPGHFPFALDSSSEEVSRQKCIQASLNIWRLVAAYREAFTLRHAQHAISYASYCAVLVMLQQTGQDTGEYTGCIRFFWSALLEYQKGCNYGLKKPLKLLKSLMRRIESLTQNPRTDEADTPSPAGKSIYGCPGKRNSD